MALDLFALRPPPRTLRCGRISHRHHLQFRARAAHSLLFQHRRPRESQQERGFAQYVPSQIQYHPISTRKLLLQAIPSLHV